MSAELRDAQYTIDDLDEGVDTSFQPAFDEDTDDDTGECKQIERLPHLRHSEEIQLLCSNVLVKDPTGLALREFLSDLEAGEVYTNETYIKALCDWKLAKGTIDYDILEIPRVISDAVRLEQYGLEVQRYAKRLETHAFNLIDIVAAVFEKLNILDGQALAVRTLLNYAVDSCSELLLLGAVQLETPWMPIECDTINNLLEVYYRSENKVPRLFVLGSLWQANRDALTSFLIEKYNSKPMEIHQIAQLITELGVAPSLVNIRPYKFALDLFTNLSVCGEFSITRYLTSVIISANVEFTIDMLGHLDALINDSSKRYTIGLKEVYEFLRVLSELSIPLSCMDQWDRVREQCVLAYPRLVAYGRDLDLILIFNQNISSEFSESIIAEVDAKIEDLRNCRVHVSEAIEYLRILRKSASPVAQDLAACMMSLMFKWYQNLSELPLKDVAIFSTFMGLLIKHRLIVGTHLTVALEWIVRSLSTDVPDSKVFKAAANTAMQLVDALDICPDQFSETLAGLDSLANFAPDIWRVARDTKARQNLAVEYCRTGKPKSDVKEDLEVPVSATKHKIQDIMQSLTSNRVRIVATELESALHDEKCTNWFVDYLVGTLVVQNLSQCDTYLELLNAIKSDELNSMVLRRTYHISLTLIKSDESTHLASAMAKLYNLGTWLGKYTLARNKPIKTNHLCFKKLLRLGGEIDRVRVVVGFTCKVLEQAGNSVVFKRSNPWVMGVLRTLLEVYAHKVGDAMWKSDIEGLFKSLGADMAKVATTARAEETKTGVNEAHTDDVVANFDLISKTIDKKVAQIRGFMKNTVDIMWHKCIGFVEPPQPCMLVVINYVEESMERSLSEGHESPAALEEAKKQIEEGAEYCRDELYKQNIEQQAAAVFSACLERNGYSSYITSDHSSILEQEMDAVRTHLYDLIYNRITKEVNRSLPAIMQGTIYSPLKLYTAQDIHHPGQSEAEKISPVESEADGSIMRVMEVPDSPKKRPEVISIGRNDDRDEFRMMRDAIDKILCRVCHSTRPHDLLSVKIEKYVKRFAGKLAKTMSPISAQLVEYTICKLVKDANTAQARETMCKLLAQLYLWSPDSEKYAESWLSRNFWTWELSSNRHVVRAMLQNKVIPLSRLDSLITSRVEKFNTTQSLTSVATLVCDLIAGYPPVAKLEDFTTALDMLHRVCIAPTDHIPQSLIAISLQMSSTQQVASSEDDVMRSAFEAWTDLIAMEPRSTAQESDFLRTLILRGMFDESRNLDSFFRSALGYCVQLYCDANKRASESIRQNGYKAVCGLATLVIRAYEFSELGDISSRLCIVNHIFANLLAFVMHVSQTSEVKGDVKDKLDGRPYYYFFMHTLLLLRDSTELDCDAKRGMYIYLADCFHFIRPTECVFFVVLWTKLVSDEQLFVKHMLEEEESAGMLVELLCSGMEFIGKYMNVRSMYMNVQDVDIMLQNVFVSLAKIRPDFMAAHKWRFTNAVHERQDYDVNNGVDNENEAKGNF